MAHFFLNCMKLSSHICVVYVIKFRQFLTCILLRWRGVHWADRLANWTVYGIENNELDIYTHKVDSLFNFFRVCVCAMCVSVYKFIHIFAFPRYICCVSPSPYEIACHINKFFIMFMFMLTQYGTDHIDSDLSWNRFAEVLFTKIFLTLLYKRYIHQIKLVGVDSLQNE